MEIGIQDHWKQIILDTILGHRQDICRRIEWGKGEANSPQKDLFLFLVASRSKKHHRYEFPSDRATGSFTSKLIDVPSIFEARHASDATSVIIVNLSTIQSHVVWK